MTFYIVHVGTGTIIDANDDVLLIDANDLTKNEISLLEEDGIEEVADKGVDIIHVINHYMGEKK